MNKKRKLTKDDMCKIASNININKKDLLISFEEGAHKYTITPIEKKLQKHIISVTSFKKLLFPIFVNEVGVKQMREGANWNEKHPMFLLSDEEIFKIWDDDRIDASEKGTKMHAFIETYLLYVIYYHNLEHSFLYFEVRQNLLLKSEYWPTTPGSDILIKEDFISFLKDHNNLKPFRVEWRIYDENILVAGSIDILFEDVLQPFEKTGNLIMMDWKRKNELSISNKYEEGIKGTAMETFANCDFVGFSIQQNLYTYLLENGYEMNINGKNIKINIKEMHVVLFHPIKMNHMILNNEPLKYIKRKLPRLTEEINQIIQTRKDNLKDILKKI